MRVDSNDHAATPRQRAEAAVAVVRADPAGRRRLLNEVYDTWASGGGQHSVYRRSALSFMAWQTRRGVLNADDHTRPGSAWWRSVNESLLTDHLEATDLGRGEAPSSSAVSKWQAFVQRPSPSAWYEAHNASIVAGYVAYSHLAEQESDTERFFLNVVLARALFAHALSANPRLALGRAAAGVGKLIGDPRRIGVDAFLALGRVLPDEYPAAGEFEDYLEAENRLGRLIDYYVLVPRLQSLYEWSADAIGQPELTTLVHDGLPVYTWPAERGEVWRPRRRSAIGEMLRFLTR